MFDKRLKSKASDNYRFSWRLAAVGAVTAYISIFFAFLGFIGLTFTLLLSSLLISMKAIGKQRFKQFCSDLLGTAD